MQKVLILENNFVIFLILILLSFILFSNGAGGGFVFDDRTIITGNPMVESISGTFRTFVNPYHYARPQSGLYRPLALASYTLNWQFSKNPASFHFVNIFLQGLIGYLIFVVVLKLKDRATAILSSVIFLFLPIHVEAVTSIVGRAELLSVLFFLLALYSGLKERYAGASFFFLLALFSKETSVAFIPVFIFLEFFWKKKNPAVIAKNLLFFLPAVFIYVFLRYLALGAEYFINNSAYSFFNPIRTADFFPGLWTAFKTLFIYLQKTVFLTYFSSDYSFSQIQVVYNLWQSWQALAGILLFLFLIYLSVKKRAGLIGLGSLIFLVSYFVISNLAFKIGTILAERLMFLPSLGLVLMVSGLTVDIYRKHPKAKKLFVVLFSLVLSFYAAQIVRGNAIWKDEKTLFENAYKHAPDSVVNMSNKASVLFREGKTEEALEKLKLAFEIEPKNSPALHLAGRIYLAADEKEKAEKFWKDAVEAQPDYLYPYLSLGALYYKDGNFKAGEEITSLANKMYATPNVITLLALNKVGLKKNSEAIGIIEKYFGKKPKELELRYVLGAAYLKSGLINEARGLLLDLKGPNLSEKDFFDLIKKTEIFEVEI